MLSGTLDFATDEASFTEAVQVAREVTRAFAAEERALRASFVNAARRVEESRTAQLWSDSVIAFLEPPEGEVWMSRVNLWLEILGTDDMADAFVLVGNNSTNADATASWCQALYWITKYSSDGIESENRINLFLSRRIFRVLLARAETVTNQLAVEWWLVVAKRFFRGQDSREIARRLRAYVDIGFIRAMCRVADNIETTNTARKWASLMTSLVAVSTNAEDSAWRKREAVNENTIRALCRISQFVMDDDSAEWWSSALNNMATATIDVNDTARRRMILVSEDTVAALCHVAQFSTSELSAEWWVYTVETLLHPTVDEIDSTRRVQDMRAPRIVTALARIRPNILSNDTMEIWNRVSNIVA